MLKVLQENLKNKSKQSLLNLKLSITSGKLNDKELDKSIEMLGDKVGENMDVSLEHESQQSPERRFGVYFFFEF
jgi:hypothetical protein